MNIDNKKLNETIERLTDETINDQCLSKTVLLGSFNGVQIQLKITDDEDEFIDCQEGHLIEDTPYICIYEQTKKEIK